MATPDQKRRIYEFDHFRIDADEGLLWRDGEVMPLTPKAFEMLMLLVENNGHVVKKEELMQRIWPDTFVEEANLTNNISLLRKVLEGEVGEQHYIKTVPRRGYRFVANVSELTSGSAHATRAETPLVQQETDASSQSEQTGAKTSGYLPRIGWRWVTFVLALVGALALIGFGISKWRQRGISVAGLPEIRSLAVLPLDNISGDSEQDYFADGMTDALISELVQIGSLRVISRNSTMNYKGARKRTPDIGRELNVDALIDGTVVRSEERMRITVNLIQAATDQHLWSKSYERDLRDVLSLQGEIGRDVAQQIRIKLNPQVQQLLSRTRPINPAAHEAYLKGLYWLHQAIDEPRTGELERLHQKSFEYFEKAIRLDPNYALAHAALSDSYHLLATSGFPQFYPKAKESALSALALDDNLADAHVALAYATWRYDWDFAKAEKEFKRAEELSPNSCLWAFAQFLSTTGRHEEAIRKIKLARDLDPLILLLRINVGWIYLDARQYDHAITQFRGVLELDQKQFDGQSGLGGAYVLKGMYDEGIAECQKALEHSGGDPQKKAYLAWAYAMAGRRDQANKILDDLKDPSKHASVNHLRIAMIYGALGERNLGMARLETAYAHRDEGLLWLKVDPTFDGLRADPRFQDLLRRIGFPQ